MLWAILVHFCASRCRELSSSSSTIRNSSDSAVAGSGTAPARSNSTPLCTSSVASPPSSRIMFGPPSGQVRACSAHHQYSSSVSPFHANTGTPWGVSAVPFGPTTTAAAAWSCVEKMLQLAQRTCAPRAVSVSISTAVWIVMCSDPVMRAPASGCWDAYSSRVAIRPGISCSARVISLRPKSARERSATLKSAAVAVGVLVLVVIGLRRLWTATTVPALFGVVVGLDVDQLLRLALEFEGRLHEAGGVPVHRPLRGRGGPAARGLAVPVGEDLVLLERRAGKPGRRQVSVAAVVRLPGLV